MKSIIIAGLRIHGGGKYEFCKSSRVGNSGATMEPINARGATFRETERKNVTGHRNEEGGWQSRFNDFHGLKERRTTRERRRTPIKIHAERL